MTTYATTPPPMVPNQNTVPVSSPAQPVTIYGPDGSVLNPNGNAYTLLTAAATNVTGQPAGPVVGGSYLFSGEGVVASGGTLKLQRQLRDGSWADIAGASMTTNTQIGVVVGQNAIVRAVLSGATGTYSVYSDLS